MSEQKQDVFHMFEIWIYFHILKYSWLFLSNLKGKNEASEKKDWLRTQSSHAQHSWERALSLLSIVRILVTTWFASNTRVVDRLLQVLIGRLHRSLLQTNVAFAIFSSAGPTCWQLILLMGGTLTWVSNHPPIRFVYKFALMHMAWREMVEGIGWGRMRVIHTASHGRVSHYLCGIQTFQDGGFRVIYTPAYNPSPMLASTPTKLIVSPKWTWNQGLVCLWDLRKKGRCSSYLP